MRLHYQQKQHNSVNPVLLKHMSSGNSLTEVSFESDKMSPINNNVVTFMKGAAAPIDNKQQQS
jgi:hypothetical protein